MCVYTEASRREKRCPQARIHAARSLALAVCQMNHFITSFFFFRLSGINKWGIMADPSLFLRFARDSLIFVPGKVISPTFIALVLIISTSVHILNVFIVYSTFNHLKLSNHTTFQLKCKSFTNIVATIKPSIHRSIIPSELRPYRWKTSILFHR